VECCAALWIFAQKAFVIIRSGVRFPLPHQQSQRVAPCRQRLGRLEGKSRGDFRKGIVRLVLAIATARDSSSAEAATIITLGSGFNEPQASRSMAAAMFSLLINRTP
jgi:hypothetical protein